MTVLAALLVAGAVALATFPELWTRVGRTPRVSSAREALDSFAAYAAPNPWPAPPAVARGPRLYDHARDHGGAL